MGAIEAVGGGDAGRRRADEFRAGGIGDGFAAQGLGDDFAQAGDGDHQDKEYADGGGGAGHRAHIRKGDLSKGFAIAADRESEDDKILNRAGQADTDQNPEQTGQIAKLSGQDRPDQEAGRAGEMAAK